MYSTTKLSTLILFMLMRTIKSLSTISMSQSPKPAALIFLHGLGDSPAGWSSIQHVLPSLKPSLSKLQYVFPPAPEIPLSINGNMIMPGWFDLYDWPIDVGCKDDKEGMLKAVNQIERTVEKLIKDNQAKGLDLDRDRIVIGGFSQGGAIALLSSYLQPLEKPYAGCVSLSGWLTQKDDMETNISSSVSQTPLFWGHGEYDDKVLFAQQKYGVDFLKDKGVHVEDKHYPMGHESHPQEMQAFADFLDRVLFQSSATK